LELVAAVGALGGVTLGVGHAIDLAGNYVSTQQVAAATRSGPGMMPTRLPGGSLAVALPPERPPNNVFGVHDDVLLAPLGAAAVTRIKPNQGGTSLSFRIDFANGARASFKPEQVWPQSDPRREIAAYRMDRLLGIGRVPPSKPIRFTVAELIAAADPQFRTYVTRRLADEALAKNGELRGMVYWWVPEIRDAKLNGLDLSEPEAMQQLVAYLQIGAEIPAKQRSLVEQLATCIVFDVIVDNSDRWSGSNTKISPDLTTLYFMDNSLSFSKFKHGHDSNLRPLQRMQVFPRDLVRRLRELTLEQITKTLTLPDDTVGLGPLINDEELRAIISRRDNVLAHIDRLIAEHGEDAVLALP
jgi:hypothetical protein